MTTRIHGLLCLVPLLGSLPACGGESNPPDSQIAPLVRLWEWPASQLIRPAVEDGAGELLLSEDFSAGLSAWHRVLDSNAPLLEDDGAMRSGLHGQGTASELELQGKRGGMYRIVPVEPDSFYTFSGRVRTEALVPADRILFQGATFFVGELSRAGTPEQVFADGSASAILKFHNLPSSEGTSDWTQRQVTLQTGPETRALVLTCVMGLTGDLTSGKVFYDDLELRHLDRSTYLRRLALEEAGKRLPSAAAGWLAERLVRENYGAETRPALVALPGESMAFQLRIPRGAPHLTMGLGSWRASRAIAFGAAPSFVIRVGDDEFFRRTLEVPNRVVDARWDDLDLDLSRWAGQEVLIELSAEDAPGVFASPMIRDRQRPSQGPNLILISIDTLRADHVGSYGALGNNSPTLDALASGGTRMADVTAQAPYTLPSQVSMFSGQFPSVHGVFGPGNSISRARTPMLAELLGREGFITRAFTAGGFVNPIFGFDRGFDGYSNLDPFRHPDSEHTTAMLERQPERFSRAMFKENGTERIKGWLGEHAGERFFLFLHTYTVHDFDPPPGYINREERIDPMPYMHHAYVQANGITPEALADIKAFYDAALRYVDHELGLLLEHLEALGLADDTIIAVTSDHGKELGERGLIIHGTTLYQELTSIPMILSIPGRGASVVEQPAMLVDLAPTLLAALGLPADPRMQGIDLLADAEPRARVIWSEVDQLARKYSIRDASGLKMIHGPKDDDLVFPNAKKWELYSLPSDPGELKDLSPTREADKKRMQQLLSSFREQLLEIGQQLGAASGGNLDEETQQMLEQLGYL